METKLSSKKYCQMHDNYEIVAVDFSVSCNNKLLCVKCLIDMIGTNKIILYDTAIQLAKDLRQKTNEKQLELSKVKLYNLKQLQNLTTTFDGYIKNSLSKLSDSIENQIKESQNELDTTDSQEQTVDLEEDMQILSQNYKENQEFNIPNQTIDKNKLPSFLDSIKELLISLQSSQQFIQIHQLIANIEKQLSIDQDQKSKVVEEHKTPSLNQLCSKHKFQIVAVNLNQEQSNENLNRLACIQCIQEVPIQYNTLIETSSRWNKFLEQQVEIKSKYQSQRQLKIKTAIQYFKQLQQQYEETLTEVIQSLNDQLNSDIKDSEQIKQIDLGEFLQSDEKSIQYIVNILSLKDQHHSLKMKQENLDKAYAIFYNQLTEKLDNLIQQGLILREKLIKVPNIENQELDETEFKEIKDNPDITEFLKNSRLQFYKQFKQHSQEQYSQGLTFSQTYKHKDLIVSQNGKLVESIQSSDYYCCLCDQMIPKKGVCRFRFKIIVMYNIMIGVGYKEIIQNTNYQGNYGIGKGTYSIRFCGRCWNHNQEDKNNKIISFQYGVNDVIQVEVDIEKKYIKWTKQQTNENFSLQIDTTKDLYPCIHLDGKNRIEILI